MAVPNNNERCKKFKWNKFSFASGDNDYFIKETFNPMTIRQGDKNKTKETVYLWAYWY